MSSSNECGRKMCAAEEAVRKWLDDLVPRIAKNLRKNVDGVRYHLTVPDDTFYMSSMYYLTIQLPADRAENLPAVSFKVVVKRPPQSEELRAILNTNAQFHNEIVFYRLFAKGSECYPKCVYADDRPSADSVVVLENLKEQGFTVYPHKYNLSLEYAITCMREFGRFHGEGYVMKETRRAEFDELVENIQETRFHQEGNEFLAQFMNAVAPRSVMYLRKIGYDTAFCDKMDAYLGNAYDNVMLKATVPTEPLSTLCHGDLTLNNMLFRKDGDGEVKTMMIDFALMRYGTPVIDLSTFIYLCCSLEVIKGHFDEMFRSYHDSLIKYLTDAGIQNLKRFSYETLLNNYKEHALFGFVITSFFLVILMDKCSVTPEDLTQMTPQESVMKNLEAGGDEVSKIIADMLLHMKDSGYLNHI